MENLLNKELRLETALEKLKDISNSFSSGQNDVSTLSVEKNQLQSEKNEIERKYNQLLNEYDNLKKKIDQLQKESTEKQKIQEQFNQDVDELGRETESLLRKSINGKRKYKFKNKDYLLSCDDGQEEDLKSLTKFLDKKYLDLKDKLGNIGENKLLLITSIQVIDEYFDLKKRVQSQKKNFETLSLKFKEMRSLAIDYKGGKDKEISNLNSELEKFKKMVMRAKEFMKRC